MAAAVTVVFNLDAAVVLLTPLYIRIARRHGYSPEMLAFQPALLACLASNPLPVSNLTNLIAAEHFDLGVGEFLDHGCEQSRTGWPVASARWCSVSSPPTCPTTSRPCWPFCQRCTSGRGCGCYNLERVLPAHPG